MSTDTIGVRFWDKVEKTDTCWLWTAGKDPNGYGRFGIDRKARLAHRVAYEMLVGPIPKGLYCCHTCDNPSCVNPEHLFIGTQKDNMKDMAKKLRGCHGTKSPNTKLTEGDVVAIREDPRSNRVIGRDYGVSNGTVGCIKRRVSWSHIE